LASRLFLRSTFGLCRLSRLSPTYRGGTGNR